MNSELCVLEAFPAIFALCLSVQKAEGGRLPKVLLPAGSRISTPLPLLHEQTFRRRVRKGYKFFYTFLEISFFLLSSHIFNQIFSLSHKYIFLVLSSHKAIDQYL